MQELTHGHMFECVHAHIKGLKIGKVKYQRSGSACGLRLEPKALIFDC